MADLVPFHCPKHGWVADLPQHARAEHKCGEECAPVGMTVTDHRAAVAKHHRNSRAYQKRLNRDRKTAGQRVVSEPMSPQRDHGGSSGAAAS